MCPLNWAKAVGFWIHVRINYGKRLESGSSWYELAEILEIIQAIEIFHHLGQCVYYPKCTHQDTHIMTDVAYLHSKSIQLIVFQTEVSSRFCFCPPRALKHFCIAEIQETFLSVMIS